MSAAKSRGRKVAGRKVAVQLSGYPNITTITTNNNNKKKKIKKIKKMKKIKMKIEDGKEEKKTKTFIKTNIKETIKNSERISLDTCKLTRNCIFIHVHGVAALWEDGGVVVDVGNADGKVQERRIPPQVDHLDGQFVQHGPTTGAVVVDALYDLGSLARVASGDVDGIVALGR